MSDTWLPTRAAADALGVSEVTLRRRRDINGGYLQSGTHYALGENKNSRITWNVSRIRMDFHARGQQARIAAEQQQDGEA